MSRYLKLHCTAIIGVLVVCIVALALFLANVQTNVAVDDQSANLTEKTAQMEEVVNNADKEAELDQSIYDEVYQAKATTLAYIAMHSSTYEPTDAFCADLASRMNISNVVILSSEGTVIAQGHKSPAEYGRARFNQLRDVFETNEPSEAFTVDFNEVSYRYYAARIDDETEIVIEHDPSELIDLMDSSSSWKSILDSVSVGLDGFAFAISSQDYTILYHPEENLIGYDCQSVGIDIKDLEDNWFGWMEINDERYYCGVSYLDDDNAYVINAIPASEISSSSTFTVVAVLLVFSIIMALIAAYAIFIMKDEEENGNINDPRTHHSFGRLVYNKTIGSKAAVIAGVGLIAIIVCSFYVQTLFSISSHSVSNLQRVEEVQQRLGENDDTIESLTAQYNRRYLNKCQMASYILSANPNLATKSDLVEMADALDVKELFVFDETGSEKASNNSYVNFTLSDDPQDQSYEFNSLLQGVDYVIQEAQPNDISGEYMQYIGVPLYNESGDASGFVQIGVVPDKLEDALSSTTLASVLSGVRVGTNGFAFAIACEDETFTYYPDSRLDGRDAKEYGIEETQLKDGFSDYLTIDGSRYFASSVEADDNYIYVATPESEMTDNRLVATLATAIASLIFLIIMFLIATLSMTDRNAVSSKKTKDEGNIQTVLPDGTRRSVRSAASRWSGKVIPWTNKSPEQKIGMFLKALLSLLAIIVFVCVIFEDALIDKNSALGYVLSGKWEYTPSIFSLTACLMVVCITAVLVIIIHEILSCLSKAFNARGVTVCRLLSSSIKYIGVIVALFMCLSFVGVDTTTLLASLGILSLVLGLGAQSLISDILAGLFIIFEGEFQVGDIVTIGDWRGTVLEIGVRTTKVESGDKDVKIVPNSSISGVINMTKNHSNCVITVGFDYGESIERVESILARELPNVKKRLPAVISGPTYGGVVALDDSAITIRISATCYEKDRIQLMRDLNREMLIIFNENDVNIPFPQVTVHQPKEYLTATETEKTQARQFSEEQKAEEALANEEA